MVVKEELAVLFERKIIDEENEEFIPCDVVSGEYNPINDMFVDSEGIGYFHIADRNASGICYAYRGDYEFEYNDSISDEIEKIKNNMFNHALEYDYIRDKGEGDYILTGKIEEDGDKILFTDIDTYKYYIKYDKEVEEVENVSYEAKIDGHPIDIKNKVTETIRGQDEAIERIITAIWMTYNFDYMSKKNMLVIGPTGVGKTAIFRKLQKVLGLPLTIFSVPGLSQAGYVGRSVDEILLQVYYDNDKDIKKAEKSIVILDEIDKLAYGDGKSGDISTAGVQNELLKLIEGCKRVISSSDVGTNIVMDTSNILFIGTGAFSELYADKKFNIGFDSVNEVNNSSKINTQKLIDYGMKRELVGRLPVIVELNAMNSEMLRDIIFNSDESELKTTILALESLGVKIGNLDEIVDIIIQDALKRGIGARGLVKTINDIFGKIFYEIANNPCMYNRLIIGSNILNDNKDFKLLKNNVKKKVKGL